ncbi:MAG: zinc ABC transporter substrate-binding protein [Thermodesulfobacteriota bacterium]|nr:zinc ABC transporter substrate-binding protein [Thermodesulfobacteriota bacterium]
MIIFSQTPEASPQKKLTVFVSIPPQACFAQRIGRDKLNVDVLLPPGKSPATYAPTPGQMIKFSRAALYFSIGVPFEQELVPKLEKFSKHLKIVDTRQGIKMRTFANGTKDPHIWMSPLLAAEQARTMCRAICTAQPELTPFFKKNLSSFLKDIEQVHREIKHILDPLKGDTILVFHPVLGYFCDLYGLRQVAVEKGGKVPRGKDLVSLIRQARENKTRVVFVQPQFNTRTADKIASAINGVVVSMNPLAREYISNLQSMALKIKQAL